MGKGKPFRHEGECFYSYENEGCTHNKCSYSWVGTLKFHDSQNHEKLKISRKLWGTCF